MYYRLSNIADLEEVESTFQAKFKHPNIYQPNQLINGLDENLVPIIKQNAGEHIDFAIWGLLPEGFKEEWNMFQDQINTLNIEIGQIDRSKWFKDHKKWVKVQPRDAYKYLEYTFKDKDGSIIR